MIRLFTSSYHELNARRRAELEKSLAINLGNEYIDEVGLYVENEAPHPASPKIRERAIERRPTYEDFFSWINEIASPDDISVVANADIWFDETIAITRRSLSGRVCYALARWNKDSLFQRNDSQDAWVFRGRVDGIAADFNVGVPRCDNRLLYELEIAGYRVENPAFALHAMHEHEEHREEYGSEGSNFVEPPYRYLWPHNLWSLPRTLIHNARHPEERIEWRPDWRLLSTTLPARALSRIDGIVRERNAQR